MEPHIEVARVRYAKVQPSYQKTAENIATEIRHGAIGKYLDCVVEARAKDVSSYVIKLLGSKGSIDPWDGVYDKIGVRIIVRHALDLDTACDLVSDLFGKPVHVTDDRTADIPVHELRYPRLHLQVPVPPALDASKAAEGPPSCEIQIRTEASNLWSRMSHSYLYKPSFKLPKVVVRSLYRLLALVELFDSEVERAVSAMSKDPDRDVNLLVSQLERIFHAFCATQYDADLTRTISSVILKAVKEEERPHYASRLATFAQEMRPDLEQAFKEYGPGSTPANLGTYILASQPESVAIFERLTNAPRTLSQVWRNNSFPDELLEDMKGVWA
ncbi:hypothetical protein GCM10020358_03770 [Amorphoplanes nipponensis]|uniref:RelA/SpoT domain-containing protein n=1 Tax=Actinoplanes nipponensis TaxID=135950 RepID=A0A919MWW9_9ACTN|nr:RelA/SpoT domain-containing protein [Actinoplanes nipponensis]GIE52655.1 hypothetical protein Ani05nite_61890 [Actinoplanes nipponensis]